MASSTTQTIVLILVIAIVIGFRIYRQSREQQWKMGSLWVLPVIFLALTVVIIAMDTTQAIVAPVAGVIGLIAGFAIGLYQGNHTTLRIDKPNSVVYIKVTPIGTAIFMVIIVLRIGFRFATVGQQSLTSGTIPVIPPFEVLISSLLLALAAGTIVGLRWYVKQRYDATPAG
jgi:hypothetical protein